MLLRGEKRHILSRAYIRRAKRIRISGIISLCSLVILTILSVFPIAKNTEYAQGIANPSTTILSMTVDHTGALVSIIPNSANGSFSSSTSEQEARFTVTTNNVTGYNLSIAASDDDGELIGASTDDALSTIGSAVSESTFSSSTSFNNKWGYKPNKYNSSANTDYLPSPTTTASPLDQTNTPNTSANSYSIAIGARINAAITPDTYENTYILVATANNVPYQINYLDNTGDTVTGLPATDSSSNVSASSFILSSGEPTRQNYVFIGWCDGTITQDGDSDVCSGTAYQPGDTYNFSNPSPTNTNVANLYAMWRDLNNNLPEMQNISYDTLNTLMPNSGDTTDLKDSRDNKKYAVTRLADGNVWMTQNLRFTGTRLEPSTSNVNSVKNITYGNLSSGSSTSEARIRDSGDVTRGVWYNYAAASAMQIISNVTTEATESVCPAGWRLPTMDEFTAIFSYVTEFDPSTGGIWYNSSNTRQTEGFWWSSTANTSSYRYGMYYSGGTLARSANSSGRDLGEYVRCIYDKSATMQNFSMTEVAAMATGATKILTDSRDNQDYTVTKLSDGNVWMTRNLAIGCNGKGFGYGDENIARNLDSTDSDVASFTTPLTKANTTASSTVAKQLCNATYGAYYNYAAASAGTINVASSTVEASSSICPKGWRLPTWSEQTAITDYVSQFNPVAGGYTNGGNPSYTTYGFWWSSTANGASSRHVLRYYNGGMNNSASIETRGLGFYVRCVKREDRTILDVTNMQDVTAGMVANTPDGTTATLRDSRDSNTYTVRKISNGLWMTQNLRFIGDTGSASGTMVMKSATSNISADTNLSYTDLTANDYDTARLHNSGNTSNGVWYNYVAATAGTITGSSNNFTEATQDICPKGWRLPSHAENQGVVSAIGTSTSIFNPVTGGYYYSNSIRDSGHARWWSSTAGAGTNRYYLRWDGSNLGTFGDGRNRGFYVRCVRPS